MSLCRAFSVAAGVLVLYTGIAAAQTGTWAAPSSGYIYDSANRSIRPVTGFIGSAVLGDAVATGIDWVSVAPNQKSALASQNGSQVWIPDLSTSGQWQALDRVAQAQKVFWAADSTQAAILAEGNQLIWLTNFSGGPVPLSTWNLELYSRPVEINSAVTGAGRLRALGREGVWSLLAADSVANRVLISLHTGNTWQLWLASSTVPPINLPFTGTPAAAVFAQGTGGVLVADADSGRIVQIQNLEATPVFTTLLASDTYFKDPIAAALSADGNRLFIADYTDKMVRVFAFDGSIGGAVEATLAEELPVGTAPLSLTGFGADRFIINGYGAGVKQPANQPILFLDTGLTPGVLFVPRGK